MQLYDDCPSGERCGPWRPGIDIRLCVRCGREVPDTGAGTGLARWGLAADYPMVAPDYAEQRSAMAHRIGLGTKRTKPTTDASEAGSVADPPAEAETPGCRYPAGRWSKPAED